MSYCKEEGKDKVIFLTKEDYETPSTASLPDLEEEPGLILDNGDINWQCPCLGGMATGPCGVEFREAFSCFHYSEEEMKGADCYDQFKQMQECMGKYPDLYDTDKDEKNDPVGEEEDKKDALEDEHAADTGISSGDHNADKNTDIHSTEKAVAS